MVFESRMNAVQWQAVDKVSCYWLPDICMLPACVDCCLLHFFHSDFVGLAFGS
jgi:hypothetical protein